MAKFENLDTPKGLAELNKHLTERSYIEGYTPSRADVAVYSQLKSAPEAGKFPHVARWYDHMSFFPATERSGWGGAVAAPAAEAAAKTEEDFDLFGEEDETEHEKEIERRAQEALAKAHAKNAAKGLVAKSVVIIDVKPWEDTTDLDELEKKIRELQIDGLEWKAAQKKPIGYGIHKLVISAHVEDEKVSVDDVQEQIQLFEDYVQSTDIASFTKL